jgi:hypothetical protein
MRIGDPQALQNPAYRLADVDLGRSAEPRRAPAKFLAGRDFESIYPPFARPIANLFSAYDAAGKLKLICAIFAQFAVVKPAKNMFKNMLRTPTRPAYLSPAWTL